MNTIICIACRLKSKRLPKKAIKPLYGKPLIVRLIERMEKTTIPSQIVLCTSHNKQDDELIDAVAGTGVMMFRGNENDVMSRFLRVADDFDADTIVRVTGDNNLSDPILIDEMIKKHIDTKSSYTYTEDAPKGVKPEIISVKALEWLHDRVDKSDTEYMTPMLHTLKGKVKYESGIGHRDLRLTVDYPEDYELMQSIYNHYKGYPPKLEEIIQWLNQ